MAIVLKPDDERLGTYAQDGSFAKWPAVDVNGVPYERVNATVKAVPGGFVVLPPDYKGDQDVTTQSAMTEPVQPRGKQG